MFIAFEGPDNVGKSTSARMLTFNHDAIYNATKDNYEGAQEGLKDEPELVQCFDRIDWFSHMVYRLSLPDHEWNDDRPRTVFAMPDTHLVVKVHRPDLAEHIVDELYTTGTLAKVNPMYYYIADFFLNLNRFRGHDLYKSVTIMEVANDTKAGTFTQRMVAHDSAATVYTGDDAFEGIRGSLIDSDDALLEHLRYVDQHVG